MSWIKDWHKRNPLRLTSDDASNVSWLVVILMILITAAIVVWWPL